MDNPALRLRSGVLLLCMLLSAVSVLADGDHYHGGGEYLKGGADACLICHREGSPMSAEGIRDSAHAVTGNPRSPFTEGNLACQSCHGPSADHLGRAPDGSRPLPGVVFDERRSAAQKNTACLSCHEEDTRPHWQGSVHQFSETACTDCHSIHEKDQVLSFSGQMAVCLDCHREQRADIQRPSSHPLRTGQMVCTDCHDPHGSGGHAALARGTVNDTCYECHAEKRGPFLWEHAPVAEDCTDCHRPHGSNHRDLLTARTPWLCQQCHQAQFHPSTAESGTGIPPRGASQQLLGRDCTNCHSQVHGSNHPSGSRLSR